jgi:putative transport protein
MMREIGIVMFLSAVGLLSGEKIVSTIIQGGYVWLLYGAAITLIPVLLVALIARMLNYNYLKICGLVAGAMTDPPALEYANSISPVHAQAATYAAVYPLTMFLRVLLAQVLVLVTLSASGS